MYGTISRGSVADKKEGETRDLPPFKNAALETDHTGATVVGPRDPRFNALKVIPLRAAFKIDVIYNGFARGKPPKRFRAATS